MKNTIFKQNYLIATIISIAAIVLLSAVQVKAQAACNLPPQSSLETFLKTGIPGESISNALRITNPNAVECPTYQYTYVKNIPSGWSMNIQNLVDVAPQTTESVPFIITSSTAATTGTYPYGFVTFSINGGGSASSSATGLIMITPPSPTPTPTPSVDVIAPAVSITSPVNGGTVPKNKNVTINATATDYFGVVRVKFFVNGTQKCNDTTAPYSCTFLTKNKVGFIYTLKANGYDAAGNIGSHTIQVTTQ